MARASRCRNDLSSSTISSVRSFAVVTLRLSAIGFSAIGFSAIVVIAMAFCLRRAPLDAKSSDSSRPEATA
jgi:hypothetical protein